MLDEQEMKTRFTYHAPRDDQPARCQTIRDQVHLTANVLRKHCPESRELSLAITKLEEAAFWANASIARRDPPPPNQVDYPFVSVQLTAALYEGASPAAGNVIGVDDKPTGESVLVEWFKGHPVKNVDQDRHFIDSGRFVVCQQIGPHRVRVAAAP